MIGIALTEVAIREGTEVYAIIRPDTKRRDRIIKSPLVHVIYGSLESLNEVNEIPEDCDAFYHFAWSGTKKTERDNPQIHEKNIKYALDAVELAKKCGCHRFIGAGSQAEYGPVDGIIDETTKFNPVTAYGIAKYAAGILSKKMCEQKGIKHIWGRIFSVYGPHDNEETMLSYAIDCFERGETAKFSAGNSRIYTKLNDPFYESFNFILPGFNVRPLEIEAAIGIEQLKKLDKFIEQRRKNAAVFEKRITEDTAFLIQHEIGYSSWFGFAIILPQKMKGKRYAFINAL